MGLQLWSHSEAAEHKTKPPNNFAKSAKMPLALTAAELLMWEESDAGVCVYVCTHAFPCVCSGGHLSAWWSKLWRKPCIFMKVGGGIGHALLKAECKGGLGQGQLWQQTLSPCNMELQQEKELQTWALDPKTFILYTSFVFSSVYSLSIMHFQCSHSVPMLSSNQVTRRACFLSSRDTQ